MRLIASLAVAAALSVGATQVRAHQAPTGWDYPFYCCSGADCAPVAPEAVREIHGGFIVVVRPGEHPMWPTERRTVLRIEIPYEKAKPSPDGHWHLCINDAGELLCFFAPGGDS